MTKIYPNYIDGKWTEPSGTDLLDNINPANSSEVLGQVKTSSLDEIKQAIDAAAKAQKEWRKVPPPQRGRILFKVYRLMEERLDDLAKALTREEGKPLADSQGEVRKTLSVLEFTGGEARRLWGYTSPSDLVDNFCYTRREPLGVVALITPWNFPVAIPVWKIAPAIIAGNGVVFKPDPQTPETAEMIVKMFEEAGTPPGLINLVHDRGPQAGKEFSTNPTVKAISFTGSNAVGSQIYAQGAANMKKVLCEMGGKNALVILEDGDLELAAASTAMGAFGATGQRCTATSRVVVMDSVADKFIELVSAKAKTLKVGPGLGDPVDVGPSVNKTQFEKVHQYIALGREEGAELVLGGKKITDGACANGYFTEPTIFDKVKTTMRIAQEEIFGPVLSIIRVNSFEEALEAANSVEFGLSSSIYSQDHNQIQRFIEGIEAGIVHINSPTLGGEAHMPFGGIKSTGVGGREMGPTAVDFFVQTKTVYLDYTGAKRESKNY